MDNDIELLHYAVNKSLEEHKTWKKYSEDLRSLCLECIIAIENEDVAEVLMRRLTNIKPKEQNAAPRDSDT